MCIKNLTEKEEYKILRKRKKITLKQISNYLDVSVSTICRFENNQRNLTENQINNYKFYINNK